jgi:hypothetical protein
MVKIESEVSVGLHPNYTQSEEFSRISQVHRGPWSTGEVISRTFVYLLYVGRIR